MTFETKLMGLEIIILSEVSQTEKAKYHMILLTCGIFKKWYKWTYLLNRNRPWDIENKLMVYQRGKCYGNYKLGYWDLWPHGL